MTSDSRDVSLNALFIAVPGTHHDGRQFIAHALGRGANAIIVPKGTQFSWPDKVVVMETEEPRRVVASLAHRFFGRQPSVIAAVTGTSGKTSVASFTRQLWQLTSRSAASIGTLGIVKESGQSYGSLTTPDAIELHKSLAQLAKEGIDHVALEASSHGLDQHRLDCVKLSAAAFTNLSHEHLDYHRDMDAYFAAKRILFADLLPRSGTAVVNEDSSYAVQLKEIARARGHVIISVGSQGKDIRLLSARAITEGQELELSLYGEKQKVLFPMPGLFQAHNLMVALGLVVGCNELPGRLFGYISHLHNVRGRLELIGRTEAGASVYVDYAHKPAALESALQALRPSAAHHLHVVFGCGGDRDKAKRSIMGEIAARLADHVIVTDDNPRTEDPSAIRAEILRNCKGAVEIGDRAQAIQKAIDALKAGDILLIAGKGHETGQIVGGTILPFDDAEIARRILREQRGVAA